MLAVLLAPHRTWRRVTSPVDGSGSRDLKHLGQLQRCTGAVRITLATHWHGYQVVTHLQTQVLIDGVLHAMLGKPLNKAGKACACGLPVQPLVKAQVLVDVAHGCPVVHARLWHHLVQEAAQQPDVPAACVRPVK